MSTQKKYNSDKLTVDSSILNICYVLVLSSPEYRTLKWHSGCGGCLRLEEEQLCAVGPANGVCHTSGLGEGLKLEIKWHSLFLQGQLNWSHSSENDESQHSTNSNCGTRTHYAIFVVS